MVYFQVFKLYICIQNSFLLKNITKLIFCYFLTVFTSQAAFEFDSKTTNYDLSGHIGLFTDQSQKLSIDDIKLKNFQINSKSNFNLGYSNANFWFKTELRNTDILNETFAISIEIPLLSRLHFYLYDQNGNLVKKLITGSETAYKTREEGMRHFMFSFSPIPNQKYTLYTLAHNDFGTTNVPFKFDKKANILQFYQKETFFLELFQGLLIVCFVITLALFVNFKDKVYLFYAIYIFAVFCSRITIFGFMFQYIHPENPEFIPITKIVFILIMATSFINFVPLVLSSQIKYFIRTQKFFYIQSAIYLSLLVYTILPFRNLFSTDFNRYLINFMNFNFLLSIILILTMVYKSLKHNYKPAKYFALAISPLMFIMIYLMLNNYSVINLTGIIYSYPFEIGFSLEISLLFGALINRYKIIMNEQKLDYETKIKTFEIQFQKNQEPIEKYQHSKYSNLEIIENHKLLQNYMQQHKPYLNPEINLTNLAEQLNIHHNLLSQVINQLENKNFFDYINSYRIAEAKAMLRSDKFNTLSAEGIGYECGFNTKATFYATFKKITGFSPAEYKKAEMLEI